jgi:hypothetical protein
MRSGRWKWLSIDGDEFLFDLATDARERANLAKRQPARFGELRNAFASWEASLPPIPPEADVSIPYGKSDLAQPS